MHLVSCLKNKICMSSKPSARRTNGLYKYLAAYSRSGFWCYSRVFSLLGICADGKELVSCIPSAADVDAATRIVVLVVAVRNFRVFVPHFSVAKEMVNVSSVRYSHWGIEGVCTLSSTASPSNSTTWESLDTPFYVHGGKSSKGVTKSILCSSFFSAMNAAEFLVLVLLGRSFSKCLPSTTTVTHICRPGFRKSIRRPFCNGYHGGVTETRSGHHNFSDPPEQPCWSWCCSFHGNCDGKTKVLLGVTCPIKGSLAIKHSEA
ncbi:hypothetical protein TSMEX_011525 [Taenia solium]|eukprot:TsM_000175100 transcript=TsM_000175100 gene=TsM_000175100